MNYRHAFHAGNFADLVKHAALASLLVRMKATERPLRVLDTHAGAGLYDLGGEMARKSGEGQAAVRLMADSAAPAVFGPLKTAVRALNPGGGVRLYPGSPVVAARLLGRGDRYLGCELRADDHRLLAQALKAQGSLAEVKSAMADGYVEAARSGWDLLLVDPPFERADEYDRIVQVLRQTRRTRPAPTVLIWLPLKDLDTFDRFLGRVEDLVGRVLVAEIRLRPLDNPLAMNGCALLLIGGPSEIAADLEAASAWVAETFGEAGARARVWRAEG